MKDPVQEFAYRNKASPFNKYSKFEPYQEAIFNKLLNDIDGVKLKFKHTILTISNRLKSILL